MLEKRLTFNFILKIFLTRWSRKGQKVKIVTRKLKLFFISRRLQESMIAVSRLNRNWIELWKGVVWYIQRNSEKSWRKTERKEKTQRARETSKRLNSSVVQRTQHMKPKRKERLEIEILSWKKKWSGSGFAANISVWLNMLLQQRKKDHNKIRRDVKINLKFHFSAGRSRFCHGNWSDGKNFN